MSKICIFGAGGHSKVVKDVALSQNIDIKAIFDDYPKTKYLHKPPVFSSDKIKNYLNYDFLICVGNNRTRKEISKRNKNSFTTLIDKNSLIGSNVSILKGTVIMRGVIINPDTKIGKHAIINTAAVIEHDCCIADYVHISPNVTITGNVSIG